LMEVVDMKKAIALVTLCLVVCASWALATETLDGIQINRALPTGVDRDGPAWFPPGLTRRVDRYLGRDHVGAG